MRLKKMNGPAGRIVELCLCAVVAMVVAPNLAYPTSPAKTTSYTESDVVRNVDYIAMADGTRLAYTSYHPKSGRYPALLIYSPYAHDGLPFEQAKRYLDAGYAVVGANWRATGCSEGVVDTLFPTRVTGKDGAEIVEWIAKQSWSDGNVGMYGHSYAGTPQLLVAAERPPHLRAIVPSALEDGYETMGYLGGMAQPSLEVWEYETKYRYQPVGVNFRISHGDTECAKIRGNGKQVVKQSYTEVMLQHSVKDEWWSGIEPDRAEVINKINVPSMIVGAFQDEWGGATREAARVFSRLPAKNKRLILMNGNHPSVGPVEGYPFLHSEEIRFLDRWVKGVKNGIENEPAVKVFWEASAADGDPSKAVAGWTTSHSTWPEPAVQRRPYFLTANGALSPVQPISSSNEDVRAYLYPTGVELTGGKEQFAVLPSNDGVLNYRTEPMSADTALLGSPEVTLYLSISRGTDTDLELILKDVDPVGIVTYLQTALHRASFQEIDEQLTTPDEVVYTFARSENLVPGKIYKVRMSFLGPIAHVVRKGHRLELTIAAPSPMPHHGGSESSGSIPAGSLSVNRVYQSQSQPSKVVLPILPGVVARGSAPECGTLINQPCRKQIGFIAGGLPIVEDK